MTRRSFTEHLAHLESSRSWKLYDRVRVTDSGRTGTLVGLPTRHNGWMVRWDEVMFDVEQGRVQVANLELIDD